MHFTVTGWHVQRAGGWHLWLFESIENVNCEMLNIWHVVEESHRTMQKDGSYKYVYLSAEDDSKFLHFVYVNVSYLQGPFESP